MLATKHSIKCENSHSFYSFLRYYGLISSFQTSDNKNCNLQLYIVCEKTLLISGKGQIGHAMLCCDQTDIQPQLVVLDLAPAKV